MNQRMEIHKTILSILKKNNMQVSVNFIILYGSQITMKASPRSDIDICISANAPQKKRFGLRLLLARELPDQYDIQIFEDLPLRLKMSVLKGKLLYCKDKEKLTDLAIELKKEYEDFLPRYRYYITGIKHAQQSSL